ncbi:hypothetical protein T440DRAFT_69767 [Plenodomus tracheiphilus IPT5]|uniref:Uncharacterized protein n=1 Tax=Plenodomus tracheiphilus IPT5 TaxID=1408161 RepID=A0A6A7BAC2_9PLEO|nr:hypothetical protein T440DRAFT_69767 [Plenodomus tracheiphilus IPT5]
MCSVAINKVCLHRSSREPCFPSTKSPSARPTPAQVLGPRQSGVVRSHVLLARSHLL